MNKARIKSVPIESLVSDAGNVRRRGQRAKTTLENSLKQFGPARSIVLDGKDIVRAGNGTLEAFAANGGKRVLVVEADDDELVAVKKPKWSVTEATAYSVADNRTGELAEWDDTGLASTLRALQSSEILLDGVGFDGDEVDALCLRLGDRAIVGDGADATAPRSSPGPPTGQYGVIIRCVNESHQREVYDRLTAEGLECRVVCV
jgi:hypothetical protein